MKGYIQKDNEIGQVGKELADNLNKNAGGSFNLGDLCKCRHTYGSHTALNRFEDGSPVPPAHSCNSCKCKKFDKC